MRENNSETEKCVEDVAETEKVNLRPKSVSSYSKTLNKNLAVSSTESSNSGSERASTVSSELTEEESAVLNQILNCRSGQSASTAAGSNNQDKPIPYECDNKIMEPNNNQTSLQKHQQSQASR